MIFFINSKFSNVGGICIRSWQIWPNPPHLWHIILDLSFEAMNLDNLSFHQGIDDGVANIGFIRRVKSLSGNDVTKATFFIHEMGDDIFKSERSKGCAGDVDNEAGLLELQQHYKLKLKLNRQGGGHLKEC